MTMLGITEPRIFTPPLRELNRDTTWGFEFIDFCEMAEVPLVPWQRFLAIHGLEIVGDLDGDWHFRFRTLIVLAARQQGKSTFLKMLNLFFCYILGARLTLGAAQNLDTAEEIWTAAVDVAESVPELASEIADTIRSPGKKMLRLESGERYQAIAASRSAGRGKSSDLVSMDELREQTDYEAWGAITKTTMARPNAQIWCFSNAGDAKSVVLRNLRIQAHRQLGDPDGIAARLGDALGVDATDDDTLGIFEWSARPGCAVTDREAWAQANPSLGYGFLTERALASACATDPENVFRTECLCQWVEAIEEPLFPSESWERGTDSDSTADVASELFFGLDVSGDRSMTSIAVCARRDDGTWHVELVKYLPGFKWCIEWFASRARRSPMKVAVHGKGAPASSHVAELEEVDGLEVVQCVGPNVGAWAGRFWDAVAANSGIGDAAAVHHRPQPALDQAAKVAKTRPLGDGAWGFDRKASPEDISPLIACSLAHGMASEPAKQEERKKQFESAYASGRSFVAI